MDEWTDLSSSPPTSTTKPPEPATTTTPEKLSPLNYLQSSGLSKDDAQTVIDVSGIYSMEDLKLVDNEMLAQVVKEAGLKMIPAKKLQNAIQNLLAVDNENNDQKEKKSDDEATESAKDCDEEKDDKNMPTFTNSSNAVDECVVIAIDRSGSMGCELQEPKAFGPNAEKTLVQRSRMDAVKQCFYAFRDRTETLDDSHHQLGLIQFDHQVEQMLPITSNLNQFERLVDDMKQRGCTAIYSAILQACHMLQSRNNKNDKTDLRVLVLTDGQNNAGVSPQEAFVMVQKLGVVVDAILVGDSPDENLRKIVAASGGTCFQIHTLSEGFELMEAESVVSLKSRRGGVDKPPINMTAPAVNFETTQVANLTPAHQAANISMSMPSSSSLAAGATSSASAANKPVQKLVHCFTIATAAGAGNYPRKGGTRRIVKELVDFTNSINSNDDKYSGIHLYPDENNIYQMKALIEGPSGSPFENGIFSLDIVLPRDYPFKPPKIRFETPIFHCNVSSNGGLCLDILKDQWSPHHTIPGCLGLIRNVLSQPNTDDALRPSIAELCFAYRQSGGSDTRYIEQAKEATQKHASRTVEEWGTLWGIQK